MQRIQKPQELTINLNLPFKILTKCFYYLGLSTFSTTKIRNKYLKLWHLKWCFIHIVVFSSIHYYILHFHKELFYIGDNFGEFNDFLKVLIVGLSHLVVLFETMLTTKTINEFFRIHSKLHQQWSNSNDTKNESKMYCKLFSLISVYIMIVVAIELNYMIQVRNKPQWLNFFIAYTPSVNICRFRMLQIMMYLEMIRIEILHLNEEILQLVKLSKNRQYHVVEDLIWKELTLCMRKYENIFLMADLFKKSCSLSFLAIFLESYVKILSDIYWTYWVIYNNDQVLNEFSEYSLAVPTALNVFLALIISKDCMRAAKLIPLSLHSLRHRIENLQLSYKIQNFSLQLSHQQIIFDAFGCFTIDCYMASGVLNSITTYIIFYIEFMPKFRNL